MPDNKGALAYAFLINTLLIGYILFVGADLLFGLYFIALEIILLHISFAIASLLIALKIKDVQLKIKYVQSIILYPLSLGFYIIPAYIFLLSIYLLQGLQTGNSSGEFNWVQSLSTALDFYVQNSTFAITFSLFSITVFTWRLLQIPYTFNAARRIRNNVLVLLSPIPVTLICITVFIFMHVLTNWSLTSDPNYVNLVITILVFVYKGYLFDYQALKNEGM